MILSLTRVLRKIAKSPTPKHTIINLTELYTNAFTGHKNHQGQDYSELSKAKLELEYLRVEPFLTVYGEVEESIEIKQDVRTTELYGSPYIMEFDSQIA